MWLWFSSWLHGQAIAAGVLCLLAIVFFGIFSGDSNEQEEQQERSKIAYKEAQKAYRKALRSPGAVDKRNAEGMTPLMLAAEANDLGPAIELVAKGALVNARSSGGWTPLMFAARRGNVEMVRFLLEHGASTKVMDKDGRTPLLCAVIPRGMLGSLGSVENREKRFPVSHGVSTIKAEVLQLLLEHGAAVDAKDEEFSLTPLQFCLLDNHWLTPTDKAVQILLQHGASTKVTTQNGKSLLHLLADKKDYFGAKEIEVVRLLLEHGVPVYAKNETLPLFLRKGSRTASASIVRLFLEHGADVNFIGEGGKSFLHYVCEFSGNDAVEAARFLLERGIPADIRDHSGVTPLMYAASHGSRSVMRFLLKNGASVNARSSSGWSALMDAAARKNGDAVRLLLEYGASITVDDLKSLQFFKDDMIKAGFYWELQEAAYRRQLTAN